MNSKFLNLNEEKQKIILKSAIREFANQGYDKASTDVIANNAGISKGSLFNYFKNKLNLYQCVLEHAIKTVNEEVLKEIDQVQDTDFYDRLKKISIIKHKNLLRYPLETQMITLFFNKPPENTEKAFEKAKQYYEFDYNFLEKYLINYLDEEKLRPGIKKEDVLFVTSVVLEALLRRHIEMASIQVNHSFMHSEEEILDFDKYIEVLKYGVYKY